MGDSNQQFDIVTEFPLPTETDIIDEDGNPKRIRFIAGCDTIYKEDQVKRNWPEKRKPTQTERDLLTFKGGVLVVPDGYPQLEKFLEAAPWFTNEDEKAGKSARKRPVGSRIIYELYDQEAINTEELDFEDRVTEARQYIQKAGREDLVSLYRLSKPGSKVSPQIDTKSLKLNLLALANENPEFILKGMKGTQEHKVVLVSKAIDYGILNLDTIGKVMLKKMATGKSAVVANVPDVGGRQQKMERVIALLDQKDYAFLLKDIKTEIKAFEEANPVADEEADKDAAGKGTSEKEVTETVS
jgi:hypothetical protein